MERESNQMQTLCRSGCGFYGSPATDGLCSICYKEALKKKQQPPVATPSPASTVTNSSLSSLMETATAQPTVTFLPSTPASDLSATDSMSEGHIPTDNQKCENQKFNEIDNDQLNEDNPSDTDQQQPQTSNDNGNDVEESVKTSSVPEVPEASTASTAIEEGASATDADPGSENGSNDKENDKDGKKKKNRCATCRKKVGLTGFQCRCGGLFCAVHRYSDKHDCSFNYREMGAEEIRRNNPVVVGEKIQKI